MRRFGHPWQGGETLSTSIGQSYVLVTPIQMANLMATIFNGGILYRPRATLRVAKSGGNLVHVSIPEVVRKLDFSNSHMDLIKKALVAVVNEPHGTGWRAKSEDWTIAGKTGTAQVVALEKEERYSDKEDLPIRFHDHAWFVAIAPAEDPQIAVSVIIENGGHGGTAAAPVAKQIILKYFSQYTQIRADS